MLSELLPVKTSKVPVIKYPLLEMGVGRRYGLAVGSGPWLALATSYLLHHSVFLITEILEFSI